MDNSSPELVEVAAMLEQHRARLTDAELDDIRRRATSSSVAPSTARRSGAMRSRAAITSMLAAGLLMTSGGAALGVSALSETHNANAAQYGIAAGGGGGSPEGQASPTTAGSPGSNVLGASGQGEDLPAAEVTGAGERSGVQATAQAQPARQLEGGEEELPFTGYVAGFALLIGLGTLAAGLMLRRATRHASLQP